MGFFKKKTLLQRDPASLSIEQLSLVQRGLIKKLVGINTEISSRCSEIAVLGADIPGTESSMKTLLSSSEDCLRLNGELESYLVKSAGGIS